MAALMEGPPLAARVRAEVADDVRELGELRLVTVQVGEDAASTIYLRRKHEAAEEAGIASDDRKLPESTSEGELLDLVSELNADESVDGILVQLPLPAQMDEARGIRAAVLVVAVGSPEVVTADMVKQGSAVVDVGINRTEGGIVGDVAPDAGELAAWVTPVPGGVGPMTIAMLLRNTVKAARYRRGVLAYPH